MVRKPAADDPVMVVSGNARAHRAGVRPRGAKAVVAATYGFVKHAGWGLGRGAPRLINLERRARFARIESA
jgi:hypothetical protein